MTTPSIGRAVHYVGQGGACRAAIVTEVEQASVAAGQNRVGLAVFEPHIVQQIGLILGGAGYDDAERPREGSWHWPERV